MGGDILMRLFLRVLAILYFIGFLLHLADIFDLRLKFSEMDIVWKIWIIYLAVMDLATAIGLWRHKKFGIFLLIIVALSQLIAYIGFESFFGSQKPLVTFHLLTLFFFCILLVSKNIKIFNIFYPRQKIDKSIAVDSDPIENAKRFLLCAKKCERLAPNVSYVLATTALEEVGKALLRKQKILEKHTEKTNPSWLAKHSDDHQKKLFWAIWTPMLGNKVITGKDFEESKELSISIHNKRINAQYSDEGNLTRDSVSPAEVKNLIQLADARIKIEEAYTPIDPDPDRIEMMKWFLNVHETREDGRLIFGNPSMKKLSELGDVYKWVCWLKEQYDNAEVEANQFIENELNSKIDKDSENKIKWKMTVKLVSKSHSIRQGEFVKWNEEIELIKIRAGDSKKKEVLVDFLLSDHFHVKTLWWQSHALVNHFIVALNIGTFGYFWWFIPTITEKFYEKLEDLEKKSELRIENHPNRPINWGNLALKKDDLTKVAITMTFVGRCKETKIFDHYLTGLGFLAKSDVVMRFEHNALEAFARSLQLTLEKFYNVDVDQFLAHPTESIGGICQDWAQEDRDRIKKLVVWAFSNKNYRLNVEPDDVGIIKILTDNLIYELAYKQANEQLTKKKFESGESK